jgi:ABC-type lipoprotein export system ATPase subunit
MIKIKNLHKQYVMTKTNIVTALSDIDYHIEAKEIVAVIGQSGSGKSTLLNILGGLDNDYTGDVLVNNKDIKDYNLNEYRRYMVGTIFQQFNLIQSLSVEENILLPTLFAKNTKSTKDRLSYLLDAVGLAKWKNHKPKELSGGQAQRVAIARSLINSPKIILADEPTGNLDSKTGDEIMALLRELNQKENVTLVIVTHAPEVIAGIEKKMYLKDGKLENNNK